MNNEKRDNNDNIIIVENLIKTYGSVIAVNNISFQVKKGDLFAFLGTNGAGKSTTIDILSTLIKKDSGDIYIGGFKVGKSDTEIRKNLGVVFQEGVLDNLLTIKENLIIRGSFYNLGDRELEERINYVSEITGCHEIMERKYGKLSGGQKRKADIARALIHEPNLLFLDEPTTGLDPNTRVSIWQTIRKMQKELNMTVFLTTHYMEEAAIADEIVIINKGKIIVSGTPACLKKEYAKDCLKIYGITEYGIQYLKSNHIIYKDRKGIIEIAIVSTAHTVDILSGIRDEMSAFEVIQGSMDDVFLNVISEDKEEYNA